MSTFDLNLDPIQIEFVLKPGITLTQAYNITNNSDETIYLNTAVLPWQPVGNDGGVNYQNAIANPNITFSLFNADIKLGQVFALAPGAKQQIVLKINASPQTALNDYYYTFFVTQQNPSGSFGVDTSRSQALGQIGSHILLTVSETENPTASAVIEKFSVSPRFKDIFFTPLSFKAEIKNNSNNFFKTEGKLTITKNDLKVAETELSKDNVLANHHRSINCQDQTGCLLKPPFWPGHYTATLTLNESLGSASSSISFFVFPFSLIGFLLTSFIIFLILGRLIRLLGSKIRKLSS